MCLCRNLTMMISWWCMCRNQCSNQPSATHPPFFDKPAFSRFSQLFHPRIVVHIFGKIVQRQVCQKGGWVADGWFKSPDDSEPAVTRATNCAISGQLKERRWVWCEYTSLETFSHIVVKGVAASRGKGRRSHGPVYDLSVEITRLWYRDDVSVEINIWWYHTSRRFILSFVHPYKIFVWGLWTRFGLRAICSPNQPSATHPHFFDNLHFEHFDKSVNLDSTTNPGWHFCRNVQNGDCRKIGD